MTFDPEKVASLRHAIKETPGEFSFPTGLDGRTPDVTCLRSDLTTVVFRADEYIPTAIAIQYARRLAASANELPILLDELERLQKENATFREALHNQSGALASVCGQLNTERKQTERLQKENERLSKIWTPALEFTNCLENDRLIEDVRRTMNFDTEQALDALIAAVKEP